MKLKSPSLLEVTGTLQHENIVSVLGVCAYFIDELDKIYMQNRKLLEESSQKLGFSPKMQLTRLKNRVFRYQMTFFQWSLIEMLYNFAELI